MAVRRTSRPRTWAQLEIDGGMEQAVSAARVVLVHAKTEAAYELEAR